jgi:hypothetical protein
MSQSARLAVKTARAMKAVRVHEGVVCIGAELFEVTTIREVEYVTAPQADLVAVCPN